MNKSYNIGVLKAVRLGARNASGPLRSLEIVGSRDVAELDRELFIRQTIGGLPGAMFIISVESDKSGAVPLTFHGGGSDDGMGWFRQGTWAMARHGLVHAEMLRHNFTGVELERLHL
jgi:peptidoglycan hydrolase-like amidase